MQEEALGPNQILFIFVNDQDPISQALVNQLLNPLSLHKVAIKLLLGILGVRLEGCSFGFTFEVINMKTEGEMGALLVSETDFSVELLDDHFAHHQS